MSRRGGQSELGFGSDSFLDIIANIVGILIILIVVAGVRVSHAPVVPSEKLDREQIDRLPPALAETRPEPPVVAPRPDLPPRPSPELLKRIESLESELAAIRVETGAAADRLEELTRRRSDLASDLESASRSLADEVRDAAGRESRILRIRKSHGQSESQLAALQKRLDEARRAKPDVNEIEHKITPVSRTITGNEVHFRLAGGRVAHVPIEELLERMREQILRRKEWLLKSGTHQGQVGPVGGFMMKYVVERQGLSLIEELRQGRTSFRIGLSEWRIDPEPDMKGETGDEALSPGSAFVRALRMADPTATLTFWVYPDSFALYRRLQKVAHEAGFTVAARPLPFGIPIAGSPHGTRSAGQ